MVETVGQVHALKVTLTPKDGQVMGTREPTIDAIFTEVSRCARCGYILLVTE